MTAYGTSTPDLSTEARRLIGSLGTGSTRQLKETRAALVGIGELAVGPLLHALRSPQEQVRWEAVKALAEIRSPSAAEGLVAALIDEDGGVRWLAAEGLVYVGPTAIEPLLHALLEHSESVWLREGAHHALRGLNRNHIAPTLTPVIRALESVLPAISVLAPAADALDELRRKGYLRQR